MYTLGDGKEDKWPIRDKKGKKERGFGTFVDNLVNLRDEQETKWELKYLYRNCATLIMVESKRKTASDYGWVKDIIKNWRH